MVQICALASGSNGNAYYIGNEESAVLIDAGISRRQLSKRMNEVGLSIQKIKAVFITHEHTDHLRGFRSICETQQISGYISSRTFEDSRRVYLPSKVTLFEPGESIAIGSILVHSFAKSHDAADPCSFRVEIDGLNIGVMTDIGVACEKVRSHFSLCHAAFIEANYDEAMLWAGPYPAYIKSRVASERGHLSNAQTAELIATAAGEQLSTLFLSHISADNNKVEFALRAIDALNVPYSVYPTSRHLPSKLVELESVIC